MKKALLFSLILAGFLDLSNFFMPIPIYTPLFLHSTLTSGYSNELKSILLGVLVACYGCAQLFAAPIFAELSDQHGRKKVILLSFSLAFFGCALGGVSLSIASLPLIFVSRILIGAASGTVAVIFAIAADYSSENERPKNLGYINTGLAMGCVIGPIIGGHLVTNSHLTPQSYVLPFYCMAGLYLLNLLILMKLLPQNAASRKGGKKIHLFTAFHNLIIAVKRSKYLSMMILMALFFQIGTESFYLAAPILGVHRFGMTSAMIANYFIVFGVIGAVTSCWLNKIISTRWQTRSVCYWSIVFYAVGMCSLIIAHSLLSFLIPFLIISTFGVLGWIHTNNLFSQAVDHTEQGLILGVSQSLWSLGGVIGTLLVGVTAALHHNIVAYLPALFILLSSVSAFLMLKASGA